MEMGFQPHSSREANISDDLRLYLPIALAWQLLIPNVLAGRCSFDLVLRVLCFVLKVRLCRMRRLRYP